MSPTTKDTPPNARQPFSRARRRDLTERQQDKARITTLEQELADLKCKFASWRAAIAGIADEVWLSDAQGKMSLINLPGVTQMGLQAFQNKTVDTVLEEVEILTPDGQVRPAQQAPLLRSLRGEVVRGEEIMRHRPTGRQRYRHFSSVPLRDAAGTIIGAIALVDDITERKQAEAAFQAAYERTRRLQAVTAALSQAVTPTQVAQVLATQGLAASNAAAAVVVQVAADSQTLELLHAVGYPEEQLAAYRSFSLDMPVPLAEVVKSQQPMWLPSPETVIQQYPPLQRMVLANQRQAWAALPLVVNGRAIGSIGLSFNTPQQWSADDQTLLLALAQQCAQALERARLYEAEHQARTAAETARQRLQLLADAGALLAVTLDYETTLRNLEHVLLPAFADSYLVDLVEDNPDQGLRRVAVGATDPAVRAVLKTFARRFPLAPEKSLIRQTLRSGQSTLLAAITPDMVEKATRNPEQAALLRDVNTTSALYVPLLARGQTLGVLTVGMTTSGRHYADQDVPLGEELARRIAQAMDNARLYAQAQQNASLLEQQVAERTAELRQALDQLQVANRAKDLMLATVTHEMRTPLSSIIGFSDLLLRRQLEDNKSHDYLTAINDEGRRLSDLVNDILDVQQLGSGQVKFRYTQVDLAEVIRSVVATLGEDDRYVIRLHLPVVAPVRADEKRVRQVLVNLLSNAVKYSPEGGTITVTLSQQDPDVQVAIQDEGLGIPVQELEQLFTYFYRGDAAEKRRIRGTGLGLALCKALLDRQHGRIWAESAGPGLGATFSFTLPVA